MTPLAFVWCFFNPAREPGDGAREQIRRAGWQGGREGQSVRGRQARAKGKHGASRAGGGHDGNPSGRIQSREVAVVSIQVSARPPGKPVTHGAGKGSTNGFGGRIWVLVAHFRLLRAVHGMIWMLPASALSYPTPNPCCCRRHCWLVMISFSFARALLSFFGVCLLSDEDAPARGPEAVQRVPPQEGGGAGAAGRRHQRKNGYRHGLVGWTCSRLASSSRDDCDDGQIGSSKVKSSERLNSCVGCFG